MLCPEERDRMEEGREDTVSGCPTCPARTRTAEEQKTRQRHRLAYLAGSESPITIRGHRVLEDGDCAATALQRQIAAELATYRGIAGAPRVPIDDELQVRLDGCTPTRWHSPVSNHEHTSKQRGLNRFIGGGNGYGC